LLLVERPNAASASCAVKLETFAVSSYLIRAARTVSGQQLDKVAHALLVAAIIVAFLYIGREILEPLVIAALLAFILSPLIRRLRVSGLWRTPAVIGSVLVAIAAIAILGTIIGLQITQLAEDLPKYETNLRAKVRALSGSPLTSRALDRASTTLRDLQEEITKQEPGKTAERPVPVEVRQPEPRGLAAIANIIRPLLAPLATTGLVILFLLFILLQREDIRDRFLRLAGTADLQRSTAALDDAASRLSRFFLMQTLLNAGFGLVIGVGLWLIGVPNAVLWGILSGLMRFVPFIGAFIAAFFPIALAAAVDPGWSMVFMTAALFVVAEPIAGHVVEPLLYGQHTGLSPVAIVISTLFWTVLWGPTGLLLATPLTVCLVVLGKHIQQLQFIEVLLGDEPALEPEESFYQRLLAGDATEAADQAEGQLKSMRLSTYYDSIPMKALFLAQADSAHGKLSREKQIEIRDTVEEIVEDLAEFSDEPPSSGEEDSLPNRRVPIVSRSELPDAWQMPYPVLCIASRSALDEAASIMFAQLLEKHGIAAWVQPFADVASAKGFKVDTTDARLVCLSYFGAAAKPAHVRYLIRRLKRLMPHAKFVAGFWMLGADPEKVEDWRKAVGADFGAASLADATAIVVAEATAAQGTCNLTDKRMKPKRPV
jgi:predicted PurR-regulated permease PerM